MAFNDNFLRACRREAVNHTPVWFMRQAGRYQKEYRALKEQNGFMGLCKNPELCAEVTLLPVQQLNVDAAILFSDISLIFPHMGLDFELVENKGPQVYSLVRTKADVEKLHSFDPAAEMQWQEEAIKILVNELNVPLIGFCGAPFTLASYMIEGGSSKNYIGTKTMMYSEPQTWFLLMNKLVDVLIEYLRFQVSAGAKALQVFDSWIGTLSAADYTDYILPHMQRLFSELNVNVPVIHFGVHSQHLLPLMKQAGGDVIGIDWKTDLATAWDELGDDMAVQGNLDPTALFGPWDLIEQRTRTILESVKGRKGHIFNVGHGILPPTDPEMLKRVVELVHGYR